MKVSEKSTKLTPYLQAASQQSQSPMFQLPATLMEKILNEVLLTNPETEVRLVCRATNESYKDISNLEHALDKNNFKTIKLMASINSAVNSKEADPKLVETRIAEFIAKVAIHAVKTKNFSNLIKILELPQFSAQTFHSLKIQLKGLPQFHENTLTRWAVGAGNMKIVEYFAEHQPKKIFNFIHLGIACKEGHLKIAQMLVANTPTDKVYPTNDQAPLQGLMKCVMQSGHIEIAELLEKFSIGSIDKAFSSSLFSNFPDNGELSNPKIALKMLKYGLERTNKKGKSVITEWELIQLLLNSAKSNDSVTAKLVFNYLEKNSYIDFFELDRALINNIYNPSDKKTDFSFAYELLEYYKENSLNEAVEVLAGVILCKEIFRGDFLRAERLLDSPLIDPSINGNLIATKVLCEIEHAIRKNNLSKKAKWIELLHKVLDHPKFDPDNTKTVGSTIRKFSSGWMQGAQSKEILDILYSHPKLTLFGNFKRKTIKLVNANRSKISIAAGVLLATAYGTVMNQ